MNILDILGWKWLEPKMHLQLENIYCNCGSPEPAPVLGSGPPPKRRTPKMLGFCLRIYVYFFRIFIYHCDFLGKKTCFFPTKTTSTLRCWQSFSWTNIQEIAGMPSWWMAWVVVDALGRGGCLGSFRHPLHVCTLHFSHSGLGIEGAPYIGKLGWFWHISHGFF